MREKPGQAGAKRERFSIHVRAGEQNGVEPTEAMINAGVKALNATVPLDVARPMPPEEDIVSRIFLAMIRAQIPL